MEQKPQLAVKDTSKHCGQRRQLCWLPEAPKTPPTS